ncbi:hypothetical protein BIW11_04872 [Tropilaelaps mercedesae]|uniref:Uncharacterized protein n=1 Tax=Tropilaelaps mercedesae TaxID=418985 RepID=A0A1V9X0Q1_9ACAR|nr:hypothetical protein BIW11_04872 [Tropilaelaps mercedesae]
MRLPDFELDYARSHRLSERFAHRHDRLGQKRNTRRMCEQRSEKYQQPYHFQFVREMLQRNTNWRTSVDARTHIAMSLRCRLKGWAPLSCGSNGKPPRVKRRILRGFRLKKLMLKGLTLCASGQLPGSPPAENRTSSSYQRSSYRRRDKQAQPSRVHLSSG